MQSHNENGFSEPAFARSTIEKSNRREDDTKHDDRKQDKIQYNTIVRAPIQGAYAKEVPPMRSIFCFLTKIEQSMPGL